MGRIEQDILRLERKRNDALLADDWAIYDSLLGDEFFHAHVLGGVLEKGPHLEHLKTGKSKVTKILTEDFKVRLYGDVAVVTAVSHVDISHKDLDDVAKLTGVSKDDLMRKGETFTRHSRYLHVWVKNGNDWKLVARQATYLPDHHG
jgi:ketosteroid isomerase-like protein